MKKTTDAEPLVVNGTGIKGLRTHDARRKTHEKGKQMKTTNEEPRLPYPTKPLFIGGEEIEEYVIPEEKRAEVLKQLYIFNRPPALDEERLDLHTGKNFRVREFRVTRERGRNWLLSPFVEEGGGSVIDWMPVGRRRKA